MVTNTADRSTRRATYEDLCAVPAHFVAELVDGELVVSPRPASPHALAYAAMGGELFVAFGRRGGGSGPGGWWILLEPEIHFGEHVLVPDLAGWRRERMPHMRDAAFFTLAPDWVCEVVSPGTRRLDRVRKMPLYAREGVRHLWLVEPLSRVLEVYRLESERWSQVAAFGGDEKVRAEPFDAVELDMTEWWLPEEAPASPAAP